jgi:multidrug efflux system membrane fusion protein
MEKSDHKSNKKLIFILIFILLASGGYYFFFTDRSTNMDQKKKRMDKPINVVVAAAKNDDVNISIKALGTITPTATVTVKTLVDGKLTKLFFREGENVHVNQKLALIDPRPYEVALEQVQGEMAKDQALLDNAKADLARYENLRKQNSVSVQVYDTQKALVHQYEATLKIDQAALKNAKLQLSYCTILAPISGRVGLRSVDQGNIVHASDQNGIVSITAMEPITALFAIPQESVQPVMQKVYAKERLVVDAYDKEDLQKIQSGYLISSDNQIDPSTGTLRLRAGFDNKDFTLFPNQFVNIHLLTHSLHNVVTIPQIALQNNPKGNFVYVVDANKSVHVREVKSSFVQNSQVVIQSGLNVGENVVIDGIDKLKDGMKVIPSAQGALFNGKHKHGSKKEQE